MLTATRMAWDAAERPTHPKAVDRPAGCVVCGTWHDRTARAQDALGKNFDILSASRPDLGTVCEPCAWALAGKPPHTLRMWSILTTAATPLPPHSPHLVRARAVQGLALARETGDPVMVRAASATLTKAEEALAKLPFPVWDRLHLCNRADQSAIVAALTSPPDDVWACSVAQSGQKHLLPYTPVNRPGAGKILVRYETCVVETRPAELAALVGACAALRLAGHGETAILTVTPTVPALTREGLAAWRRWAPVIVPHANSPVLGLAYHLTTKETLSVLADTYT